MKHDVQTIGESSPLGPHVSCFMGFMFHVSCFVFHVSCFMVRRPRTHGFSCFMFHVSWFVGPPEGSSIHFSCFMFHVSWFVSVFSCFMFHVSWFVRSWVWGCGDGHHLWAHGGAGPRWAHRWWPSLARSGAAVVVTTCGPTAAQGLAGPTSGGLVWCWHGWGLGLGKIGVIV